MSTMLLPTAVVGGYAGESAGAGRSPIMERYGALYRENAVSGAPSIMRGSVMQTDYYPGHGNGPFYRPIIVGPDRSPAKHPIVYAERPQIPLRASTQAGRSNSTWPRVYHKQQPYRMDVRAPTWNDVNSYMSALGTR